MSIQDRLREDLVAALLARGKTEASMIRILIAAIENAEAVDYERSDEPKLGLNHDRPRRELSDEDIMRILESERAEVAGAAAHYRELGLVGEVAELDERVGIVDRYLARLP